MARNLWLVLAAILAGGCGLFGGEKVTVLPPDKFTQLTNLDVLNREAEAVTNALTGGKASISQIIRAGTLVTILVGEDASLSRQYQVPERGVIDYPPLGRLMVEGLTVDELAQLIKEALEKDYLRHASVTVTVEYLPGQGPRSGSAVIYILGRVARPGPLYIPKTGFTLGKAIIAAGGIDTFGNGGKVQVIRYDQNGKKYKTVVNVTRVLNGQFEKDVPVQDGDWVVVPEKLFSF